MTDLSDLIARIEAASGPDREINAEIGRYAPHLVAFLGGVPDDPQPGCLPYTASIDTALTLVPTDAFWRLGHDGDGADPSEFRAQLIVPKLGGIDARGQSIAATPALALCAAALRARSNP